MDHPQQQDQELDARDGTEAPGGALQELTH